MVIASATAVPVVERRSLSDVIAHEGHRRRRRRWLWRGALGLLPFVGAATFLALKPGPEPLASRFRSQAVSRGDIVREVLATGRVEAVTNVEVGAEISGRIAVVEVDYNDRVTAGQVLARFDRSALEAQLAQTRAALAAADAAVAEARIARTQAERGRSRAKLMLAEHLISDADAELAVSNAKLAAEQVTAAVARVAAERATYALASTNRDRAVIRSPIDGIVITRNVDPGQTVASAFQSPVLFSVAADLRSMRVVAAVDEADIGEVQLTQQATFSVNAYAGRVFEGVVTEVRNSPVVVQDVVTYAAVVVVQNPDLVLKPGMTASVRIRTSSAKGVLRVPNAALHFTPPGESPGDGSRLWLLAADQLRPVSTHVGISDADHTEIAGGTLTTQSQVLVELTPEGRLAYGLVH
jgi:HlyD family secretion protein